MIMDVDFRAAINNSIELYGAQLIGVAADPSFTYTIGLSPKFGAELLIIGLRPQYASAILNDIIQTDSKLILDVPNSNFTNLPVMFKLCTTKINVLHSQYVVQADQYYRHPVQVIQMVMCDPDGRFPGHPQYNREYMDPRQPVFYEIPYS